MKDAYILRGISGSGKSTLANILAVERGIVHSTDSYFMVDGVYRFDPSKLAYNHSANQAAFRDSCKAGFNIVVCDNTNMKHWEMGNYIGFAKDFGYNVHIILVGNPFSDQHQFDCAARNKHGLTLDIIKKMAAKFEL